MHREGGACAHFCPPSGCHWHSREVHLRAVPLLLRVSGACIMIVACIFRFRPRTLGWSGPPQRQPFRAGRRARQGERPGLGRRAQQGERPGPGGCHPCEGRTPAPSCAWAAGRGGRKPPGVTGPGPARPFGCCVAARGRGARLWQSMPCSSRRFEPPSPSIAAQPGGRRAAEAGRRNP